MPRFDIIMVYLLMVWERWCFSDIELQGMNGKSMNGSTMVVISIVFRMTMAQILRSDATQTVALAVAAEVNH